MKRSLIAALCLLTFGSLVSAQSLVDIAKKEKERRKKVEAHENRTYNERDLKSKGLGGAPPSSATKPQETSGRNAPADASNGSAQDASPQEDPTKTQGYWHDKVSAIDKKIQDLERRLKSPQMTSNVRGASDREKAERDLADAHKERDALVDEARRQGVPPGWLR